MGGRGFAPKAREQRRNKTKPARGEWVDLQPLESPVLPELPELAGEQEWSPRSRASWEAWRRDPVTAQWSEADVEYALDTILMHHASFMSKASEIRLRMDALGLTPKGKRDLRWRLPGDPAAGQGNDLPKLAEVRPIRAVEAASS